MNAGLKQRIWTLSAVVALSMVALVVLSGMAEAQGEYDAYTVYANTAQNAVRNDNAQEAAAAATPREATYEPAGRLIVEPGDSLWSMSRDRLGPEAAPGQVMNEVGLIYELNRDRIGDDPNLILPGQELLVPPPVSEPAPEGRTPGSVPEPAVEGQGPASVSEEAAPVPPEAVEPLPSPNSAEHWITSLGRAHRLLGVGILSIASVLTLFMAWRMLGIKRSLRRDPKPPYAPPVELDGPEGEQRFPPFEAPGFKRGPSDPQDTATVEDRGPYRVGVTGASGGRRQAVLSAPRAGSTSFLRQQRRPTGARGRQVRRCSLRHAPRTVPQGVAVATNERASEETIEVPKLSAKRKRRMRSASLAGLFARGGRAVAKGEQGSRGGGPRKDLRDLEKKAG